MLTCVFYFEEGWVIKGRAGEARAKQRESQMAQGTTAAKGGARVMSTAEIVAKVMGAGTGAPAAAKGGAPAPAAAAKAPEPEPAEEEEAAAFDLLD